MWNIKPTSNGWKIITPDGWVAGHFMSEVAALRFMVEQMQPKRTLEDVKADIEELNARSRLLYTERDALLEEWLMGDNEDVLDMEDL